MRKVDFMNLVNTNINRFMEENKNLLDDQIENEEVIEFLEKISDVRSFGIKIETYRLKSLNE